MQTYQDKVNKLASLLKERKYVVVLTGAGISTESGLPDFRSSGGLWDGEKPEEISHWSAVGTEKFKNFFLNGLKKLSHTLQILLIKS
ncbi:Sir2 family NAD-dependent protein deacetylase [Bacillus stercoris]|nr:Sir2 family NAD-dependent protein deacetylase [Bacillus stercoris]